MENRAFVEHLKKLNSMLNHAMREYALIYNLDYCDEYSVSVTTLMQILAFKAAHGGCPLDYLLSQMAVLYEKNEAHDDEFLQEQA